MLETMEKMLRFLVKCFHTYSSDNKIWILYPAALVLIWILGKREDRKLFLGVLAAECLTVFNPFAVQLLLKLFGFSNRYVRFFWLILFFVTIAYAATLLIFHFKKVFSRVAAGVLCMALVVGLGTPVFWGKDVPEYRPAQNVYFTDTEILELANIFHSEGIENPKILYEGLMLLYRQYDPGVRSLLSRYGLRKLQQKSMEDFLKMEKFSEAIREICQVYYYQDFSVPAEQFYKRLCEKEVTYMVSTSAELDAYVEEIPVALLGRTTNCRVWKVLYEEAEGEA